MPGVRKDLVKRVSIEFQSTDTYHQDVSATKALALRDAEAVAILQVERQL